MPVAGDGSYSLPAAYLAVLNAVLDPDDHNTVMEDIQTALSACIKANGSKVFSAEQTVFGNPTVALGIAPKQYVDAQVVAGVAALKVKSSVATVTTGNVTLSAEQTLDGVLTSASRVLVRAQTAPAENGVYVTGAGAWARATDFDAWTDVPGALVAVEGGTQFADTVWLCTADTGGTLNTTAITFRRIDNQWKRNAQTGTTYTVLMADHNKHVTHSNGSAIATTLPQATGNFGDGFAYISQNLGAGANTITPTTSTINGAATLVQRTGDAHFIFSDGANYRAISLGMSYEQLVGLTEDTTGATGDWIVTGDISATQLKKMLLSTLQTLFAASQAQMETGTSTAVNVTPGNQKHHPLHPKAWCMFDGSATGTNAPSQGSGVTSVTRNGAGNYTVNLAITMANTTYGWFGTARAVTAGAGTSVTAESGDTKSTTALQVRVRRSSTDAAFDSTDISVFIFGDI